MAYKRRGWNGKGKAQTKKDNKKWYPYKNEFEYNLSQTFKVYEYETKKIPYSIHANYNPDFIHPEKDWLIIEAKGFFLGGQPEARKYVWVKKSNPDLELVFILDNPNKKAYTGCKRRKDGSYLTMGEWCSKQGFVFFRHTQIPKELAEGNVTREWLDSWRKRQREHYFGK